MEPKNILFYALYMIRNTQEAFQAQMKVICNVKKGPTCTQIEIQNNNARPHPQEAIILLHIISSSSTGLMGVVVKVTERMARKLLSARFRHRMERIYLMREAMIRAKQSGMSNLIVISADKKWKSFLSKNRKVN